MLLMVLCPCLARPPKAKGGAAARPPAAAPCSREQSSLYVLQVQRVAAQLLKYVDVYAERLAVTQVTGPGLGPGRGRGR